MYKDNLSSNDILLSENNVKLKLFDSEVAWQLGCKVRELAATNFPGQAVKIDIISISGEQLFHAVIGEGTSPDNDNWVRRKRNTVLKFQNSSYYIGTKLKEKDPKLTLIEYYDFKDFAVHGGAVPIRVQNVSGPVGILTVSGLKQWQDHGLAIEALQFLSN